MECIHLDDNVMITADTVLRDTQARCCSVCRTDQSPWMCLTCGKINCGRYVGGHAKDHCDALKSQHCVCIDCDSCTVFCYTCDEFVINDTISGHLESIRKHLQELNTNNLKAYDDDVSELNQTKENRRLRRHRSSLSSSSRERKRIKQDDSLVGKRPKTLGLINLGNTCFMNAVLQSLSNIQSFCGYMKQLPSLETSVVRKKPQTRQNKEGDDFLLVEELRKTLVALWEGGKTAISPESLFQVIWKVVPRFRGYQQQDAHEFMRYLLDRLHTELLTLLPYPSNTSPFIGPRGKTTIVNSIFGGILQSEVNCLVCGTESKKHDPFLDLSLDIPSNFTAKTPNPKNGEMVCRLTDCLSSFMAVEELEESELYMCANCKLKQRSTKKFWIRQLPNVLCLHLKRFRWSSYFRVKVDTYVDFPLYGLDMSLYMLNNLHETRNSCGISNEYDLAAVIVHHGTGAGSGHYTSYATHEGSWYHFNDSMVTSCTEETVRSCKAYMLFYVRRDIKLPNTLNKSSSSSTTSSSASSSSRSVSSSVSSKNLSSSKGSSSSKTSSSSSSSSSRS